jgi:hypothetical protein
MLQDFFKLNAPFNDVDEAQIASMLHPQTEVTSSLYRPDVWPHQIPHVRGVRFNNFSLSKTIVRETTFTDCVFTDCLFIGSTFQSVQFHRCRFINSNFYKAAFQDCYLDPGSIVLDSAYRKTHANVGTELFQSLLEDSSRSRQADFAMRADIEFRRWKRWQLSYDEKQGKITRWHRHRQAFLSRAYEWLSGFGYKPLRFILWTIVIFIGFSVLNKFVLKGQLVVNGDVVQTISWIDSIFYTFSMMTVLGFSTVIPQTEAAKLLAVSEALIGVGWLGLFTSLLVKRFTK